MEAPPPMGSSEEPAVMDPGGWRKRLVEERLFGDPDAPFRIGRFVVLGTLGRGGMGTVLRAYDETLERPIAIKLLTRPEREEYRMRMLREAQALARLSHPNVVQVYEVGEVDGQPFIAMELICGQTLQQWQATPRSWRACVDAYVQAGRGLAAAHGVGLVHRDFKPSNCIIDHEGRVRVLDFGLAMVTDPLDHESSPDGRPQGPVGSEEANASEPEHTETGLVLGTLGYMSPEQRSGATIDARADQYAFCVSLYEAMLGTRPARASTTQASAAQSSTGRVPRLPPPRWLLRILERGLAREPRARYLSMTALLDALERRRRRRWAGWVMSGVLGLGALVAGGMAARSEPAVVERINPCRDATPASPWHDEARARVQTAILATDQAFAPAAWSTVESQLDGYATALSSAYVDACETTKVRNEQTRDDLQLRTACLDERAAALRHTVALLARADAGVVERAVTLVVALPELPPCAEVAALRRAPAAPAVEATNRRELREDLLRARALTTAGKHTEALELVTSILARTEGEPAATLRAEAWLLEGMLRADLGQPEPAASALERALDEAMRNDRDALALEALCELVYVVGVEQAKLDAGIWLGSMAQTMAARADAGEDAEARALTAVAQPLVDHGRYQEGQQRLERAIALLREHRGPEHLSLAEPLDSLGVALRKQGKLEAARTSAEQALAIRTRWQGAQHPSTLHQRINLGVVLDDQGEHRAAQEHYGEVLAALAGSSVDRRELVAHARAALASSLAIQGDHRRAVPELQSAIEIWEALHGPEHPWVTRARLSLAGILRDAGRHEHAVEHYERVWAIVRSATPTPARDAMMSLVLEGLVASLEQLGRKEQASARRAEYESRERCPVAIP